MMRKTAIMAESVPVDGKLGYIGRSVPVSKTFEFDGYTFFVVKIPGGRFQCIEAETGASIANSANTLSKAYANATEALNRGNRQAMLKTAIDHWLKTYGKASDLACATVSL